MLIKQGKNAVNTVTDTWLGVPEDMNMEIGQLVQLSNKKTYEVIRFFGDGNVMVGPPSK